MAIGSESRLSGIADCVLCDTACRRDLGQPPSPPSRCQPKEDDDEAAVTATQLRDLVARLIQAGQWRQGDPDILLVVDAGYDTARLAFLLDGLPVEVLGRLRSDRVLLRPAPSRAEFLQASPGGGRPPKHGGVFRMKDETSWGEPDHLTSTATSRYGTVKRQAKTPPFTTAGRPTASLYASRSTSSAAPHTRHRTHQTPECPSRPPAAASARPPPRPPSCTPYWTTSRRR